MQFNTLKKGKRGQRQTPKPERNRTNTSTSNTDINTCKNCGRIAHTAFSSFFKGPVNLCCQRRRFCLIRQSRLPRILILNRLLLVIRIPVERCTVQGKWCFASRGKTNALPDECFSPVGTESVNTMQLVYALKQLFELLSLFVHCCVLCSVVNPGKFFNSNSIGSPSIRSNSRHCDEFINHSIFSFHTLMGF